MRLQLYQNFSYFLGSIIGSIVLGIGLVPQTMADGPSRVGKKVSLPIPESLVDVEIDGMLSKDDLEGMTFQELDDLRTPRKLLIDYLIEEGQVRESPKGTLDFLAHLNEIGRRVVKEENEIRMMMFTVIAKREKKSFASIGREFHRKITAKPEEKSKPREPIVDVVPSLQISAPLSVNRSLLSHLIGGYLDSLGYGDVSTDVRGDLTRVIGRRSFGSGYIGVDLRAHSPTSRLQGKMVVFDAGSSGAVPTNPIALEGLSIVAHRDNPVNSLTVSQVADIFAGKIRTWSKVRGGNDEKISVIIPGANPNLKEQFRQLVLTPEKERFGDYPDQKSQEFLKELKNQPNAIAFCHIGEVPDSVKPLKIKAASDSVALAPSRINVLSLDYPLLSYISVRTLGNPDGFMKEFIAYCQSEVGQTAVTAAGYLGNGGLAKNSGETPEEHRDGLLNDSSIPDTYKDLIRNADRINTPANFRFVPKTRDFELTGHSQANLDRLANYLLNSRSENYKVILIGFADDQGNAKTNRTYSAKRADSLADKLRKKGITNIKIAGIGEDMPVADNSNESGRSSNRRVEVWIER